MPSITVDEWNKMLNESQQRQSSDGGDSGNSGNGGSNANRGARRAVRQDQQQSGGSSSSDPTPFKGTANNPQEVTQTTESVKETTSGSSGGSSGGNSGSSDNGAPAIGEEAKSGRVGDAARDLESKVIEKSAVVNDRSQVKVTQKGDTLEAELTKTGQQNAQKAAIRRGGIKQKARAVRETPDAAVDQTAAGVGAKRAVEQSPDKVSNPLAGKSSAEKQAANKRMIGSMAATTRGATDEFTTDRISPAERGKAEIGGAIGTAQDFAQESYDSTVGAAGRTVEKGLEKRTGVEFTRSGSGGGLLASEEAIKRHDATLDAAATKTGEIATDSVAFARGAYDTIDISDEINQDYKTGLPASWAVAGPQAGAAASVGRRAKLFSSSRGLSSIDEAYHATTVGRATSTGTTISGGGGGTAAGNIIDKSVSGAKLAGAAGAGTVAAGEIARPDEQSFKKNEFTISEDATPTTPTEFTIEEGAQPTSPSEFTVNDDALATSPTEFELSEDAEPVSSSELSVPDQSGTGAGLSTSQMGKQRQRPADSQGGRSKPSDLQEELDRLNERFEGADQPENLLDERSVREGRRTYTDSELEQSGVRDINGRLEEAQQPEVVDESPSDLDASRDTTMMDEATGTSPMTGVGTGSQLDSRPRTSQRLGSDVAQDIRQDIDQDIRMEPIEASATATSSGLGMGNPNRTGTPNEPGYPGVQGTTTTAPRPPRPPRDLDVDVETDTDDDSRRFAFNRGEFSNPVFTPGEVASGKAFVDLDGLDDLGGGDL